MATNRAVDPDKLNQFLGKFVGDLGAAFHGSTVMLGERLGLYRAMAGGAPIDSAGLAKKTGTHERFVREWLAAQAASGYVDFDARTGRYSLSPEQEFTLADESSPAHLPGGFYLAASLYKDAGKVERAYRDGKGLDWKDRSPELFVGTEKFFRPSYAGNLVQTWIPALNEVDAKLRKGAKVADVGCGHGASTLIMAAAYPKSHFTGFDYHPASIDLGREAATSARLGDRVTFEVESATSYPGNGWDLVTFFDCLHDMGDPVGAARHVRGSLRPDGTWMIVEPFANPTVAENLNPVGRVFYSASSMICVPASLAQEKGMGLGAQASDAQLQEVATAGGFSRFRRATQTPFNRVFEARP